MSKIQLEITMFIVYLVAMVAIGVYFFVKSKEGGEKTYFLGNRAMGPWVTALSAGASDMSAWVLMGLPTAIYTGGLKEVWIALGLAVGYAISWIVEAPRLRKFSIVCGDAITIPQFLSNRFKAKSYSLQVICAVVFLLAYTIYSASSIKACGILFHKVLGVDTTAAMYLAGIVIVSYTFLGGFSAVCWTDFFQGMLVLGAMLIAPIVAAANLETTFSATALPENYWNAFADWKSIASGLGWGLGYFGMPHIIIRFMSIKSQKELRKSAVIGISWTVLIVIFAAAIGLIGRVFLGMDEQIKSNELVFVEMVRTIFSGPVLGIISGILLAAVLAASMSTADSQLLAASSAFSSDVYKPLIRNGKAEDTELLWTGRFIVLIVALLSLILATNPNAGSIMDLVENAWGLFGAAFGPTILLSLFWRRFNFVGAISGIIIGATVDIVWLLTLSANTIYEIIPGFFAGLLGAVIITLCTPKPSQEVEKLFDDAVKYED